MHPLRAPGWFLLALVLLLALPAQAARLALVIGNDAYQKVVPLKNARNDARLMAGILKKAGFDVTPASDLSRDGLWGTIDTFRGRIQKGDEVVFYFAGHGVQIGANQLLLPVDIAALNDAQVQRDGVPLLEVQDALRDARVAVLLLDACRDNPFPKTGTRTIGGTRGLSPPEPSTGQIIMMSAGRNQKALDYVPGQQQGNGLFTWELSQALQTPGVEIRAALEQVKERVDDKARRAGHEQRPSLVNDLRGNFYLSGGKAADRAEQFASVSPEPTGRIPQSDPEEDAWAASKAANTVAAFDAYLSEYPHGRYASAARVGKAAKTGMTVQPSSRQAIQPNEPVLEPVPPPHLEKWVGIHTVNLSSGLSADTSVQFKIENKFGQAAATITLKFARTDKSYVNNVSDISFDEKHFYGVFKINSDSNCYALLNDRGKLSLYIEAGFWGTRDGALDICRKVVSDPAAYIPAGGSVNSAK